MVLSAAFAVAFVALCVAWWRHRRRSRAPHATLPAQWQERVFALVPQTQWVSDAQHEVYLQRVEAFLARKRFIGCQGLEVSDDMRIAIAGLAALLILREDAKVFPALRSVLLYPDAFLVHHQEPDELGLVSDEPVEQVGESWQGDRVVLSWADVEAALHGDAVNVVAHEFAHQLDDETPDIEGAPQLLDYTRWSAVMQREYERLQRHRRPPVLDPYGGESPAEFFGVVTEAFFQQPHALHRHHADLYALLRDYYRLDPAAVPALWTDGRAAADADV